MGRTPEVIHGKIFERDLHEAFKDLYKELPVRWGRVTDTAEAGNIIKKAEADFRLMVFGIVPGFPFMLHIEAKATIGDTPFQNCFRSLVKGHQNAAMVMSMRAGACGAYFVRFVGRKEFEVWDAELVSRFYPKKRTAITGAPAYTIADANMGVFARQLCDGPNQFQAKLRSTR